MYEYFIHQFHVRSEFPLPADPTIGISNPGATLAIRRVPYQPMETRGEPIASLFGESLRSYRVPDGILFAVEQRVQVHVSECGRRISVFAAPGAEEEAALYTIGMGIAFCGTLHGCLCLHAAAVELDGHRIGVLAPSGTGKSTTAWALLQSGAFFANDDQVLIRPHAGSALALPSGSLYPKVDRDMLSRFAQDAGGCTPVVTGSKKLWFPLPAARRVAGAAALAHLYVLKPVAPDSVDSVRLDRVRGLAALALLLRQSQGTQLAQRIRNGGEPLLARWGSLVSQVPVSVLTYPKRFTALPALVETIRYSLDPQAAPSGG